MYRVKPHAQKCFSHPSLVIYFFATPTHKSETGTAAKGWGGLTTNGKPTGPIIMIDRSETLTGSQIIFITYTLSFFSAGAPALLHLSFFHQPPQIVQLY
jgi:hypothetical protein